ncbi:MAG: site-2 protease family protein [Acidimicrobiales bacterium]
MIALIGWYPDITALRLILWVAVASAAVMWHELGHAFAARRLGASPTIELYGFGGATSWRPVGEPSRSQLIGVSFAGPFAGFVVGAAMGIGVAIAGGVGSGDARYFVLIVLWTNVGWGLVNLLPILPLDGGHILAELLPGDRATRTQRAALVSIVVAIAAIVGLLSIGVIFGALILGWIVMANVSSIRAERATRRRADLEEQARDALHRLGAGDSGAMGDIRGLLDELRPDSAPFRAVAIETAAATGNTSGARDLLQSSPEGEALPPGLYALVFAIESDGHDGVTELLEIFHREPVARHARWLALALRSAGRLDELASVMRATGVDDPDILSEAASVADALGHPSTARQVRSLGPDPSAT